MTQKEFYAYHEASFDAFCKKVIKHAAADAHRMRERKKIREVGFDDPMADYLQYIQVEDKYTTYCKTFYVDDIPVAVTNELIGEALQFIVPGKRAVLLLSYFMEYSDTEIAKELHISNSTVKYRKQAGINRLKELMEGMNHEKQGAL